MKIRPGRLRSLIAGIVALIITAVGLMLMPGPGFGGGFPGIGPGFGLFRIVWLVVGLIGAAAAFYNAFSEKGVPLYEIDVDERDRGDAREDQNYCPKCGARVSDADRFCRQCGAPL